MSNDQRFERMQELIAYRFGCEQSAIQQQTTFSELGVDSLDAIELFMELEDEFNLQFPNEAMESFNTVQDVITYINQSK